MSLVGSGAYDAMVSAAPKYDWDIAAGDLIVCESGGCVSAHDGSPLLYNRAKPLQKSLICAGPTLYDALIARMREVTFPYQPR